MNLYEIEIQFDGEDCTVNFDTNEVDSEFYVESCINSNGDDIWSELTSHEQDAIRIKVRNNYHAQFDREYERD